MNIFNVKTNPFKFAILYDLCNFLRNKPPLFIIKTLIEEVCILVLSIYKTKIQRFLTLLINL
ncbi:MAG: hypothetical protein B6D61_07165 [Bacteroidetes bacterium 4484_249]|nr:MAG: hypothetical protein B6D61_07165 [Bacteroidetes bacterium 4484_249]